MNIIEKLQNRNSYISKEIFWFSELLLMTVATEKTDAFLRYLRSAEVNKLKGKVGDLFNILRKSLAYYNWQ